LRPLPRRSASHPWRRAQRGILVFALAGPWGGCRPEAPLTSKPSAAAYPIVFTSDRSGSPNIYVIYSDGTRLKQLTTGQGPDVSPAWSPSGSQIVFTSGRTGNNQLYVMAADGSHQTNVTRSTSDDSGAVWSPDGTRIAFFRTDTGFARLFVARIDGTDLIGLSAADLAPDRGPVWSPDGRQIAFIQVDSLPLSVVNSDGSGPPVGIFRLCDLFSSVTWSPDGHLIGCTGFTPDVTSAAVYLVRPDGTSFVQIAVPILLSEVGAPAWSPDSHTIAFDATGATIDSSGFFVSSTNRQLFLAQRDGSGVVLLSNNEADDHSPAWSLDGSHLVFSTNRAANPDDIYIVNAPAGDGARNLTADPTGRNEAPQWSPHH
jgi:Tol biopolymer transport system component